MRRGSLSPRRTRYHRQFFAEGETMTDAFSAGTLAGAGSFRCDGCGFALALTSWIRSRSAPSAAATSFRRALLFEPDERRGRPPRGSGRARMAEEARERIEQPATTWRSPRTRGRGRAAAPAGRASAAAWPPTSASTTRRCRAATRSCTATEGGAPHPRRPQPQRRVRQRRAGRARRAGGRRRDRGRPVHVFFLRAARSARAGRRGVPARRRSPRSAGTSRPPRRIGGM